MLLQEQVADSQHQRMTGMHQDGAGDTWFVGWLQGIFFKADAIVAFENRLLLAAITAKPATDCPILRLKTSNRTDGEKAPDTSIVSPIPPTLRQKKNLSETSCSFFEIVMKRS